MLDTSLLNEYVAVWDQENMFFRKIGIVIAENESANEYSVRLLNSHLIPIFKREQLRTVEMPKEDDYLFTF